MNSFIFKTLILERRILYSLIYLFDSITGQKYPQVSILCYHSIASDGWRFSVTLENFKQQIEYLKRKGIQIISMDEFVDWLNGKKILHKPAIVLTFDDGYENVLAIKEYAKEQQLKPTLFALAKTDKVNRAELGCDLAFLTSAQLKELKSDGWIIGSHGSTHANFYHLSEEQIQEEVMESKNRLEQELAAAVEYIAYPKGAYTKPVLEAVKTAGYRLGLSMNDGVITSKTERFLIPRIGVDGTHSLIEFKALSSQTSTHMRQAFKKTFLSKFL